MPRVLEAEEGAANQGGPPKDAAPSQTKRRRLEYLKSTSVIKVSQNRDVIKVSQNQNVMIDETMETGKLEEIITEERHVNRRDRIEKSLKAVLQNMLRDEVPMVNMLCNRETLKGMIDELDEN